MNNIRKLSADLYYIGLNDRKLALFENVYPIPQGVSYNSYILLDDKNTLIDCADIAVAQQFLENIRASLQGRSLDYIVINHMEPDHGATLALVASAHPEATIVTTAKAAGMIRQFFDIDIDSRLMTVGEGDTLHTGRHTLTFFCAPMVHWPEVMVTYESATRTLFSADAFGTFGTLNGHLFADESDLDGDWLGEARRYYCNIVGKYGMQVQALLKKAAGLDIATICPLHGPIWRKDIAYLVEKYNLWSSYTPEQHGVLVVYGSIYGHTAEVAERAASLLADNGVKHIAVYDASHVHVSHLVGEAFRFSHLLLASSTYNNSIFTPMEIFLADLKAHNLQNRRVALIENGSWAPQSGKLMRAAVEEMKGMTIVGDTLTLKSSMKENQTAQLEMLAQTIAAELND